MKTASGRNAAEPKPYAFPAGAGELATRIRESDWTDLALAPPATWSVSLKATVELILAAKAEIVLFWGPEFVALYNDAYAPTIGDKHPQALGRPARENWAELWDDLHPMLRSVRETGETVWAKDRPFQIQRHGYLETVYFDISYSAVREADGSIGGVLCIVSETTERVRARNELLASEARFRALVNATSDVIYRMSPDWREMTALDGRGFLRDTEAPSTLWQDAYLFAEDRAEVGAAIDEAVREKTPFQLEHRVRRADGTPGWTLSRAVPVLDDAGEILEWFGAASDITSRRATEEHLRLVINELNHRVKNTLATLQAIGEQTFRNAGDLEHARETFLERIMALSRANDLLNAEHWAGASLSDVVRLTTDPERTEVSGPAVQLSAQTAMSLSMALHELATNARKYGAWSTSAGRVAIDWSVDTAATPAHLRLVWRERGGPTVKAPNRRGFGSKLIERGLARELGGDVRLSFEPEGIVCAIEAPMPALAAGP